MLTITLTQENIDWENPYIEIDNVLCEKNGVQLRSLDILLALENWTSDIIFSIRAHIPPIGLKQNGNETTTAETDYDSPLTVTYEIYKNMGEIVQDNFKNRIFIQATNYKYYNIIEFEQLSPEDKQYFIEQAQKNNLVCFNNLSSLFTFWKLQKQGLITKEEINESSNGLLLMFLVEKCAIYGYSRQVAFTWSHQYVPEYLHENYFLLLNALEGDYTKFSEIFSRNNKYKMIKCIHRIEESDLLRVIYLFLKFPKLFITFRVLTDSPNETNTLTYKDIIYMKICFQTGITKDYTVRDRTKEDLEKLFKEKYNRVPKVFGRIVSYCDARNIKPSDFIKAFDYKLLSKLLKNYHLYTALDFMTSKFSTNLIGLSERVVQVLSRSSVNEETFIWLEKHKATQEDLLIKIINYNLISDSNMTLKTVKGMLDMQEAKLLMKKVEEKYAYIDFKFANYKSKIINCTVEVNTTRAYMLKDERIALLGDLTCCCQKLDDAGESAMMYGLVALNAGFWACEKSGRIFAQAEVWTGHLNHDLVLVFDNIELANDRPIRDVEEVLQLWCKKSRYPNIIMGRGYNELIRTGKYIPVEGDLYQPECKLIPNPYTDTRTGCVWLKKDGVVAF